MFDDVQTRNAARAQRNITGGIIDVSIKCLLSLRYFRRKIITAVYRGAPNPLPPRFVLVGTDILLHLRFFRARDTRFAQCRMSWEIRK